MDFLTGDIKQLFRKYLIASMASAMLISIYGIVDSIAVGQSEGAIGSAAMAVIMAFYGVLIFLSVLCGVGGSVLMGNAKGEGHEEKGNAYFTASLLLISILIVILWMAFIFFHELIFTVFGANDEIMPKVLEYGRWLVWFFPVFILPGFISSFIRNDGAPERTMVAVITGGCINVFGDWFFVFPLKMGMSGAAMATAFGTIVQFILMCSHFFTKNCHLRLVKPFDMGKAITKILRTGFGTGVIDLGTVILAIIMNNQILRYGNTTALAVYGVIATVSSIFQSLFVGVGQGMQPIVSSNCGAGLTDRIKKTWNLALTTVIMMGIVFTIIGLLFPTQMVRLFMDTTPEVITAAPGIIRPYFLAHLFLGINVAATYYLQSIMRNKISIVIALMRSVVISGLLLFLLPACIDILGVWLAIPISELIVTIIALCYIRKRT